MEIELNPKRVVPIHTFHPDRYDGLAPNVSQLKDGEKMEL